MNRMAFNSLYIIIHTYIYYIYIWYKIYFDAFPRVFNPFTNKKKYKNQQLLF